MGVWINIAVTQKFMTITCSWRLTILSTIGLHNNVTSNEAYHATFELRKIDQECGSELTQHEPIADRLHNIWVDCSVYDEKECSFASESLLKDNKEDMGLLQDYIDSHMPSNIDSSALDITLTESRAATLADSLALEEYRNSIRASPL
jgi:hypothetical protein